MSFLNTLGKVGSVVANAELLPLSAAANALGYDTTPGYSATNVARTQAGNIFGGSTSSPTASKNQNTGAGNVPQPGGDTTTVASGAGGSGLSAQQQLQNQQAISIANAALGRLPGQLQTALGQVQNTYNQNNNELDSSKAAAQQNYGQSTQQNQQQFVTNKNQINDQSSQGLRGLLTLLGQHGAGGSSAAMYAAPDAVNQVAAQQRSGAGQTFGQNQQGLDTNWNTYQTGFDNSKKQLADWFTQQNNAAQSSTEQSRQSLLQTLAGLQGSPGAAQPYIDQINQSADKVNQLGNFNPTYTGTTPTYTAPDVASYTVNQTGAPTLGSLGNNTGASPALSFLLGLNKDKQQQPTF